jgi:hypothetical protein
MEPAAPPSDQDDASRDGDEREVDGIDLATLGLAVFFLSVIGVVVALLVVQNLL